MSLENKACCSIPPVVTSNYTPKGAYETIHGMKTYVTGPADATTAVLVVYDIFGFYPQTIQGADIIAHSGHRRVFMPDFFDGQPAEYSWFPPTDEGKKAKLGNFFATLAAPPKTLGRIPPLLSELNSKYSSGGKGFTGWGIVGFCWGGKIATLISKQLAGQPLSFKAALQAHPAMLDAADAEGLTVPHAMLASRDEPSDAVGKFVAALKGPGIAETYPTMNHGWMAARSNLQDPAVVREYKRGYGSVVKFLADFL